MGDDVKKGQHTYKEVRDLQYKGQPIGNDGVDYTIPDSSEMSQEYYPDELLATKEFAEFSQKLDIHGYNIKVAKKLFEPIKFKRTKLVPGTEDNPQYTTEEVSLSADQTVKYIENNNKTNFFTEVTRNGNEGFHFAAFCQSKGMTVEDMEYGIDHPDTEKGRELNQKMDTYRVELYEMLCNDNFAQKKEQFTKFYADYVESQTKFFSDIIKKGDLKFDDLYQVVKYGGAYQSLLQQTIKYGVQDKKIKQESEAFVKGVEDELKKRGSDATFSGLEVFGTYCNVISQGCEHIQAAVDNGEFLNGPKGFRGSTKGQITQAILSYNSMRKFLKTRDKENPAKSLAQLSSDELNDIAEDVLANPISENGFDMGRFEGRQYLADTLPEIVSQRTGVTVSEQQAKGVMNESLAQLNDFAKEFENDPKYAPLVNDIVTAGKNFAGKTGDEKIAANRDLKLMSSLFIAGASEEELANNPKLAQLKDCTVNILAASNAMQKTIELDAYGVDVIDQSDAPAYDEANRMLEENFADRMKASQKKIFGKSSEQFTNMQNALDEYNNFTKGLSGKMTPEQQAKQREQLLNIKKLSADYIGVKEGQKLNKHGQERFQIAKEVNAYFNKAYINSMDAVVDEMVKNPNIQYGKKDITGTLMADSLQELNNAAFRTALRDVGGEQRCIDNLEIHLKTVKSAEEFKEKIAADKSIPDKDVYLANADLLFACHQKDVKDAPARKARAREMLNNAKYPMADRDTLEQFAKDNNIKVKDPAGDKKYLENVERIRQYRIDSAITTIYEDKGNITRWGKTLLSKPGLSNETRQMIISEFEKPHGERTQLYEYILNEFKNADMGAFLDKDINEQIEKLPQEEYYRLMAWDRDNMFKEMDVAIKNKTLSVDETEYKQIRQFVSEANVNASAVSTKINQYERNQSMVMDIDEKSVEDVTMAMANAMATNAAESLKCYLVEQIGYAAGRTGMASKEFLEQKQTQMKIAADPKCAKEKFAEQSAKYWNDAREKFTKLKTEDLFMDEKKQLLDEIIDDAAQIMYYNSSKLNADKMSVQAKVNVFDPKVRDASIPEMKAVITEKLKSVPITEVEKAIFQDEVDMNNAYEMRDKLGKRIEEKKAQKVAEKAAEQQRTKEAREKKNAAPEKSASKGNVIS